MTRKDFLAAAAGVAAALTASKTALAQTTTPPGPSPTRGELGSARNIQRVRQRLDQLIDQLQYDRHDYGGYRVKAIAAMQQARADLDQALQWDSTHPH